MNNYFKTGLMATMVAAAFAPTASQAQTGIFFQQQGTGNFAGSVLVAAFSYDPANALLDNVVNGSVSPTLLTTPIVTLVSGNLAGQAVASNVGAGVPGCNVSGGAGNCAYYFTYQFNVPVTGTQTLNITNFGNNLSLGPTASLGSFAMYAHAFANTPNRDAGTGYGSDNSGILILSGGAVIDPSFNMSLFETLAAPTPFGAATGYVPLGVVGGLNRTTPTVQLTGSTSMVIDATYQNTSFFLSDVTSLTLNLAFDTSTGDMTQPEGFTAPFDASNQVNAAVVGITPGYGANGRNDFYCTSGSAAVCDMQLATTSNTFFNHFAPEPGSLALLALGLGIAGVGFRRRKLGV